MPPFGVDVRSLAGTSCEIPPRSGVDEAIFADVPVLDEVEAGEATVCILAAVGDDGGVVVGAVLAELDVVADGAFVEFKGGSIKLDDNGNGATNELVDGSSGGCDVVTGIGAIDNTLVCFMLELEKLEAAEGSTAIDLEMLDTIDGTMVIRNDDFEAVDMDIVLEVSTEITKGSTVDILDNEKVVEGKRVSEIVAGVVSGGDDGDENIGAADVELAALVRDTDNTLVKDAREVLEVVTAGGGGGGDVVVVALVDRKIVLVVDIMVLVGGIMVLVGGIMVLVAGIMVLVDGMMVLVGGIMVLVVGTTMLGVGTTVLGGGLGVLVGGLGVLDGGFGAVVGAGCGVVEANIDVLVVDEVSPRTDPMKPFAQRSNSPVWVANGARRPPNKPPAQARDTVFDISATPLAQPAEHPLVKSVIVQSGILSLYAAVHDACVKRVKG